MRPSLKTAMVFLIGCSLVIPASAGNPPFEEYNVQYLPLHLLLDREGRIVDVNPRGDQLDIAVERALDAEGPLK